MARNMGPYEIITVCRDATIHSRMVDKAPQPSRMIYHKPKGARWVMRYFPRENHWRLFDVRKYIMNPTFGQFYRAPKPVIAPGREAAIMYALLCLN
jgi:hypothetical protein